MLWALIASMAQCKALACCVKPKASFHPKGRFFYHILNYASKIIYTYIVGNLQSTANMMRVLSMRAGRAARMRPRDEKEG